MGGSSNINPHCSESSNLRIVGNMSLLGSRVARRPSSRTNQFQQSKFGFTTAPDFLAHKAGGQVVTAEKKKRYSHTVQRREHVHFNSSTATEQAKDEPFYLPKAWGRAGSQTGTFLPVEHTHSPTLNLKAWSNDRPLELIRNTKHKESNLPLTSR